MMKIYEYKGHSYRFSKGYYLGFFKGEDFICGGATEYVGKNEEWFKKNKIPWTKKWGEDLIRAGFELQ